MAYQRQNRSYDNYGGQSVGEQYNSGFDDLNDRRGDRQSYRQFQNKSYDNGEDNFDSYQDRDFDSPRNGDYDSSWNRDFNSRPNGNLDYERDREFLTSDRDLLHPSGRDFDVPGSRAFHSESQINRDFESPRYSDFDSPKSRDFDSPRSRDFGLPRGRDFDSPKRRDFDSPNSENFHVQQKFHEERPYRAHDNYAYSDNEEEYQTKISSTQARGHNSPFDERYKEDDQFEERFYSGDSQNYDRELTKDFGGRDRNSENGGDDETFSTRIGFDHSNLDGKDTVIVRKRKPTNIYDQLSESDSSSLKAISKSRSMRKSVNLNTLPSHEKRIKNFQARKLEALRDAKNLEEYTQIYREEILQEPVQRTQIWKYQQKKAWQNFKQQAKNVLYQLELWSGAFKEIEGQFGTSVMTYFRFMRWLLFLNFYLMVVMLGLTMVPYVIKINRPWSFLDSPHPNNTESNFTGDDFFEKALNCTKNYIGFLDNQTNPEDWGSKALDTLQGTGWMEHTVLFYGTYFNKTYSLPLVEGRLTYNMGLSYLLATGAAFLVSFFLLVKNSAKGVKSSVLDEGSGQMTQFCNKVFGGWDFCISNQKAAKEKHKNLTQELRGDLDNQKLLWKIENRTTREKAKLYSIRVVVNTVVLGFLGGSLYLIYYANNKLIDLQREFGDVHPIVQTLIQFMPSVTITLLNIIVPIIFKKLVEFEDYMPAFQMQITLLRTVILRLASLLVLMGSLYGMVVEDHDHFVDDCGNKRWQTINNTSEAPIKCWETYVGQQIYKLIILDFLVPFVLTFIVEYPRRLVYQRFHERFKAVNMMGQQEFDLPKAVLDLVYTQTLCWMGLFFCPFIPMMSFVKCFIFFYVKKGTVLNNCIQPVRPFRTSKSNSLFIAVLFISFIISCGPMTYMIGTISPSQSCGPFRVYSVENFIFFDTIRNLIFTFPSDAQKFFHIFGTMAFFIPAIGLTCFFMYYYCVQAVGYKRRAKLLKEDLIMEGKDKQFLLARVNEAWMYIEG